MTPAIFTFFLLVLSSAAITFFGSACFLSFLGSRFLRGDLVMGPASQSER